MTPQEIATALLEFERELLIVENGIKASWHRGGQQAGPLRFRDLEELRRQLRKLARRVEVDAPR